ncbi:MAG: hypothetical protein ACYDH9_23235 [Limisphaerales bacterium]
MKSSFRFPGAASVSIAFLISSLTPANLHAQVYTVNVVGYVQLQVPSGFSMIANQVNRGANTVGEVLTVGAVDGLTLYKYDSTTQNFSVNVYLGGAWSNPTESFAPGEGAFLFNPSGSGSTLTLVGSIDEGIHTNSIPAGLSIRSSLLPESGQLSADLNFPAAEGDIIYRFDNASGTYKVYTYDFDSWTAPPSVNSGESFFVWKPVAADWTQVFTVH